MRFAWDPKKAAKNFAKHGVRFEVAELVFEDPGYRSMPQIVGEEERWLTIGRAAGAVLLVVAHTVEEPEQEGEEETVRIISARKATARERGAYEQG